MQGAVTVHMNASPDDVFALVSDVTRIGRYSPETFEAEWIDGATEPKVGAKFRGHVKRNGRGRSTGRRAKSPRANPARSSRSRC
jgi:hypothetical protein